MSPSEAQVPRVRSCARAPIAIRPTFGALTALFWQEGGVLRVVHGRLKAVFVAALAAILLIGIPTPPPTFAADPPGLARFMTAIGRVESGGRYTARNARTGAYGKYQIIPSSWRGWARLYLHNANARKTPANQEKVAAAKFRAAYRWLGGSWQAGRLQLVDRLQPQVRLVEIRDVVRQQGDALLRPGARPAGAHPEAGDSDSEAEPDPHADRADSFAERRSGSRTSVGWRHDVVEPDRCGDRHADGRGDPQSDRRRDLESDRRRRRQPERRSHRDSERHAGREPYRRRYLEPERRDAFADRGPADGKSDRRGTDRPAHFAAADRSGIVFVAGGDGGSLTIGHAS